MLENLINKRSELKLERLKLIKEYKEETLLLQILPNAKPTKEQNKKIKKLQKRYELLVENIYSIDDEISRIDEDYLENLSIKDSLNPDTIEEATRLFG